ncbi:cysteine protease StiP family protein [Biostraticola tofi]|uniref:RNA binding Pelota-like protein n=1 Tax=Biostraticola tofi TaxID=466109 RepID=A0A4R3YPN5_9GAMM|nr:cysteine protease StiP family protein [Biostraticola tofi]TCV94331.1 RNA binding Pelota-like protein [Biostraticola tofi]
MTTVVTPFSGTYLPGDVEFLLRPVQLEMTPVEEKETLIQSGARHYSDMLSQEPEPSAAHLALFEQALAQGADRLAREVAGLAAALAERFGDTPIILVSLVRAGVPLGVMLQQALRDMGRASFHYGISIIRDRGIDPIALSHIEQRHGTDGIVFVDGWTGKGAIGSELQRSLSRRPGYGPEPRLAVLADPCGNAWLAASLDDWLIPFGILGAPVSGLVSRSLWSEDNLHGCVICHHLSGYDCSRRLVDNVARRRAMLSAGEATAALWAMQSKPELFAASAAVVSLLAARYDISSRNRIKPGIAEATRAVLRRVPDHILVRRLDDPDVALLAHLAGQKNLEITEMGDLLGPYRAVTIIKKVL